MNHLIAAALLAMCVVSDLMAQAGSGVYVGGHIRRERPNTVTKLKNSGFTYVILFNVDVQEDGTLKTDGETICKDGEYVFERVMFWNIPNDDLEEVHIVWQRARDTIRNGVQLIQTPSGVSNDLPKQSQNRVSHVRPHGKNASDKLPLPDGRMMTKQCFWLNNTYIKEQISKTDV